MTIVTGYVNSKYSRRANNDKVLELIERIIKIWFQNDVKLLIWGDINYSIEEVRGMANKFKLNKTKFKKTKLPRNSNETDMIASSEEMYDGKLDYHDKCMSDHFWLVTKIR